MLWRVRTTMQDRPGSLAVLARHCGEQGVNILGLQIFPGVGGVTDELVLRAPEGWRSDEVTRLVDGAGGTETTVAPCSEHALVDSPIQYLHALARVAHDPALLEPMLARLLDAEPTGSSRHDPADDLSMLVTVGSRRVTLHRATPFTATEHARAVAFADVARGLVGTGPADPPHEATDSPAGEAVVRVARLEDAAALSRMHQRCSGDSLRRRYGVVPAQPDDRFSRELLLASGGSLVAAVGDEVVGLATLTACEPGLVELALIVEDDRQRRGLGARLLTAAARLARGQGADDLVCRGHAGDGAAAKLAYASGLRARARLEGRAVVVTINLDGLKPLAPVPARQP